MIHLDLPPFGDRATLELLGQLGTRHELNMEPGTCFWLGSVSRDDEVAFRRFLDFAQEGAILELNNYDGRGKSRERTMSKKKVLFICVHNSARSQMVWLHPGFVFLQQSG
jgi:hypothetical protein